MSRVASKPVELPQGVTATVADTSVAVKGAKGNLTLALKPGIKVEQEEKQLLVKVAEAGGEGINAIAGATRAHLANMILGVSKGYDRKLELVGVGYRAAVQGRMLNLTLGFSHPIAFAIPEGITIETPSQTEILIKGIDRQKVGQVAAEIRALKPPEPYKGKGIRYVDEVIKKKVGKTGA